MLFADAICREIGKASGTTGHVSAFRTTHARRNLLASSLLSDLGGDRQHKHDCHLSLHPSARRSGRTTSELPPSCPTVSEVVSETSFFETVLKRVVLLAVACPRNLISDSSALLSFEASALQGISCCPAAATCLLHSHHHKSTSTSHACYAACLPCLSALLPCCLASLELPKHTVSAQTYHVAVPAAEPPLSDLPAHHAHSHLRRLHSTPPPQSDQSPPRPLPAAMAHRPARRLVQYSYLHSLECQSSSCLYVCPGASAVTRKRVSLRE